MRNIQPPPVLKQCERLGPSGAPPPVLTQNGSRIPAFSAGVLPRSAEAKKPRNKSFFKPGHDSALKSLLRKIIRGEAKREDIPQAARANVARIKFIQADPGFQEAFAKPGQPQRRQPAKGETA